VPLDFPKLCAGILEGAGEGSRMSWYPLVNYSARPNSRRSSR
jgi:hypothetical protein